MRGNYKKKIVTIVFYLAAVSLLYMHVYIVDDHKFTFFEMCSHAINSGLVKQVGESCIASIKVQRWSEIMFQVVTVLYLVATMFNKRFFLNYIATGLLGLCVVMSQAGSFLVLSNVLGLVLPMIQVCICIFEIIVLKMMDLWKETVVLAQETAKKGKEEKEEIERRLKFQGKYTELFYQVIWNNFKYDWKDFGLFLACSTLTSSLVYTGLSCYWMMSGLHRKEAFLMGEGLGRILVNAMIPMAICALFLMVFILIFYLQKWMESCSIFMTLGIRKRALYIILALEIIFAYVFSVLAGFLLGNILTVIVRKTLTRTLGDGFVLGTVPFYVTFFMIGIMVAVYVVSLMATRDITVDFNLMTAVTRRIKKEKMPKKATGIMVVLGIIMILAAVILYGSITRHESMTLLGFAFVGVFLILRFGGARILRNEKEKESYYINLMDRNHLYHKSKTNTWYVFAMIVLTVSGIFYFAVPIASNQAAEEPEEVFPYDYVCIADDGDAGFFEQLEKDYETSLVEFPMVRVSNTDKTEKLEGYYDPIFIQGQQIGVSENTYHELKMLQDSGYQKVDLGLDPEGEAVYLVHQQDSSLKAQPVDWTFGMKNPQLHIGMPCKAYTPFYSQGDLTYSRRKIAGEEFGSLIGCFRQGKLENLVVFSDEYFEKAKDAWTYTNIIDGTVIDNVEDRIPDVTIKQGPTKLVLIQAKETDLDAIDERMNEFRANHAYEENYDSEISSCYIRRSEIKDMRMERAMKSIVNTFVAGIMLITIMFLLYVKLVSEMKDKERRAYFLKCMGMTRKDRVRLVKREVYYFLILPVVTSGLISVIFLAATFKARMYTGAMMGRFLLQYGKLWIIWLVIEVAYVWILGQWYVQKVEGKNE